jgi:high-affinity iron transporter
LGLFFSLAIGAAFIAVWFTKAANLWSKSEELWEGQLPLILTFPRLSRIHAIQTGIFELIAALMIFVMGITMLKMDRAKAKWRIKLENAFEGRSMFFMTLLHSLLM